MFRRSLSSSFSDGLKDTAQEYTDDLSFEMPSLCRFGSPQMEEEEDHNPIRLILQELVNSVSYAVALWPLDVHPGGGEEADPCSRHVDEIIELVAHGGGVIRLLRSRRRRNNSRSSKRKLGHSASSGGSSSKQRRLDTSAGDTDQCSPSTHADDSMFFAKSPRTDSPSTVMGHSTPWALREQWKTILPNVQVPPDYPAEGDGKQLQVYEAWLSDRAENLNRAIRLVDVRLANSKKIKSNRAKLLKQLRKERADIPEQLHQEIDAFSIEVQRQTKLAEILRQEMRLHQDITQSHRLEQVRRSSLNPSQQFATIAACRGEYAKQRSRAWEKQQQQQQRLSDSQLLASMQLRRTCSASSASPIACHRSEQLSSAPPVHAGSPAQIQASQPSQRKCTDSLSSQASNISGRQMPILNLEQLLLQPALLKRLQISATQSSSQQQQSMVSGQSHPVTLYLSDNGQGHATSVTQRRSYPLDQPSSGGQWRQESFQSDPGTSLMYMSSSSPASDLQHDYPQQQQRVNQLVYLQTQPSDSSLAEQEQQARQTTLDQMAYREGYYQSQCSPTGDQPGSQAQQYMVQQQASQYTDDMILQQVMAGQQQRMFAQQTQDSGHNMPESEEDIFSLVRRGQLDGATADSDDSNGPAKSDDTEQRVDGGQLWTTETLQSISGQRGICAAQKEPRTKKRRTTSSGRRQNRPQEHPSGALTAEEILMELDALGKLQLLEPKIDIGDDPLMQVLGGGLGAGSDRDSDSTLQLPDYYGRFLIEQDDVLEEMREEPEGERLPCCSERLESLQCQMAPSEITSLLRCNWNVDGEERDEPTDVQATTGTSRQDATEVPKQEGEDPDENVSVTLTLTAEAANDVNSVLAALADLLNIAPPQNWSYVTNDDQHSENGRESRDVSDECSESQSSSSEQEVKEEAECSAEQITGCCANCEKSLVGEGSLNYSVLDVCTKEVRDELLQFDGINASQVNQLLFCSHSCCQQFSDRYLSVPFDTAQLANEQRLLSVQSRKSGEASDTASTQRRQSGCDSSRPGRGRQRSDQRGGLSWCRLASGETAAALRRQIASRQEAERTEVIADTQEECIGTLELSVSAAVAKDNRECTFCRKVGDLPSNGPGRLINIKLNQWCHLNCALWSDEVYETVGGALVNVQEAVKRSRKSRCTMCDRPGASISCFNQKCSGIYHLPCSISDGCVFYQNKTVFCMAHCSRPSKASEVLDDKTVCRKVWVNRDDLGIVESIMRRISDDGGQLNFAVRVGSLVLHSIGHLTSSQILGGRFHSSDFIYPVGYKATRFYWSMHNPNRRCKYICSISEMDGGPLFRVVASEPGHFDEMFTSSESAQHCWQHILKRVEQCRQTYNPTRRLLRLYPAFIDGNDLFGLSEPVVVRLLECVLAGIDQMGNYIPKQVTPSRRPLLAPLPVNPTGCARAEPITTFRTRRNYPLSYCSPKWLSLPRTVTVAPADDSAVHQLPYTKHFTLSKSSQYRKMRAEWRSNVYLSKSNIQGLGLCSARELEKHTMVIEYIGEIIRNEVANKREKRYERQNRGVYMFRIDDQHVIDATMAGGLARYINHSCEPNCVAEVLSIEKENRIIIITNRKISRGEELTYDYKLEFESETSKIPCWCGSASCRKWMN